MTPVPVNQMVHGRLLTRQLDGEPRPTGSSNSDTSTPPERTCPAQNYTDGNGLHGWVVTWLASDMSALTSPLLRLGIVYRGSGICHNGLYLRVPFVLTSLLCKQQARYSIDITQLYCTSWVYSRFHTTGDIKRN